MKIRNLICIVCSALTIILAVGMIFWEDMPNFVPALPFFAMCIFAVIDLSDDDNENWFDKKI